MNKLLIFAALGAASLSISSASAAIVAHPGASSLAVEVRARSFQPYEVSRKAFQEFRGDYSLENGESLRLSQYGRRFFVEVSGQPAVEIRATTSDTFAAVAGGTELVFERHANGLVSRVLLKQPVAS